jgi:hypothetical protein
MAFFSARLGSYAKRGRRIMIWIRSHMDNERWEAITDCPTNGIRGSMQHIYTHAEHSTEAVARIDKGACAHCDRSRSFCTSSTTGNTGMVSDFVHFFYVMSGLTPLTFIHACESCLHSH